MTKTEIIKACIEHDQFDLLNKQACQMTVNDLLQSKEITLHDGKFYLTYDNNGKLGLDEFVKSFDRLFSFKRLGVRGKSGNKAKIRNDAQRFSLENKMNYGELYELAEQYLGSIRDKTYCCASKYFFYKNDNRRQEFSYAKAFLETEREEIQDGEDFNTNMDD
jgi:phosphoribosylaminoimidazole-succinocarboxamide synthase